MLGKARGLNPSPPESLVFPLPRNVFMFISAHDFRFTEGLFLVVPGQTSRRAPGVCSLTGAPGVCSLTGAPGGVLSDGGPWGVLSDGGPLGVCSLMGAPGGLTLLASASRLAV